MDQFESFFSEIYGDRWGFLKEALLAPAQKQERDCFSGHAAYVMDGASIRAAQALQVKSGESVLDLCAAPGGKTLILLEALQGKGSLVANELSSARRRRLDEVLRTHVPEEFQRLVRITGFDGNQFGLKKKNEFDKVLLDAPCSSERHWLEEDAEMKEWKPSRTRQLAPRQYSLLCSALLTVKAGGKIIYSTCSISPLENDGVIQRLLERKSDEVMLDPAVDDLLDLERTESGFQIFPDRASGAGPIYLSRLVKI